MVSAHGSTKTCSRVRPDCVGGGVRRVRSAVEFSISRDKWFLLRDESFLVVVRDIARLSRYIETSSLNYLSADPSTSLAKTAFRELALTVFRLRAQLKGLANFCCLSCCSRPVWRRHRRRSSPQPTSRRERIEQQLKELRDQQQALLNSMQQQVAEFNARIAAMEAELGVTPPKDQAAQAESGAESSASLPASAQDAPAQTNPDANGSTLALATPANSIMDVRGVRYLSREQQGLFPYEPLKASFSFADLTGRSTSPQKAMCAT